MNSIATYSGRLSSALATYAIADDNYVAAAGSAILGTVSLLTTGAKHAFLGLAGKFKLENAIIDTTLSKTKLCDQPIIEEFYDEFIPSAIDYINKQ